jgi:hypothetical protein
MLEFVTSSLVYSMLKDAIGFMRGHRRALSPSAVLALRQKWKPLFERHILDNHTQKLREDVIIRDMKRIDAYPDLKDSKGISPWFRVGLIDTYHRGILVALGWKRLISVDGEEKWRSPGCRENGGIKVLLAGRIPYENIDNVDWKGDEYYSYPHIYCFFNIKKEPYEDVGYYAQSESMPGHYFYTLVADYHDVRKLNKRLGVED